MATAANKLYVLREIDGVATKFPNDKSPLVLTTYTYTAKRMGGAPSLDATVYYDYCLDNEWTKEEYVEFNGERFYVDRIPSSTKDTSNHLYKHEISLTSRRQILDNILFFDTVSDSDEDTNNGDAYRSNMTSFTFGGTIEEFVARVNSSLVYCGLYDKETQSGYNVIIDEGYATDDVKEISFEDKFITEVLQEIYNTYGLNYYWVGKTCHVGDVEQEVGDVIQYGVSDALLSVDKENTNNQIVDMATGYGSSENIPYYYPNNDQYGTAIFETENCEKSDVFSVNLGTVMSWNGDVYNKPLSLVRYTSTTYTQFLGNPNTKQMVGLPSRIIPGEGSDFVKVESMGIPSAYTVGLTEFFEGNSSENATNGISVKTTLGTSYGYAVGSGTYDVWNRYLKVTRAFKIQKAKFNEIIRLAGAIEEATLIDMWGTVATGDNYSSVEAGHVKTGYQQARFSVWLASVRVFTPNGGNSASDSLETYDMFPKEYWDASTLYTNDTDPIHRGYEGSGVTEPNPTIEYTVNDDTDEVWVVATYHITSHCYAAATSSSMTLDRKDDVFVRASLLITGGVTRVYTPVNSKHFIKNESGDLKVYDESGVTFLGIDNLPAETLSYKYDATQGWSETSDTSNPAATIRITGRDWIYPTGKLMPSIYRSSGGKERFLYALNDTHLLPDSTTDYYTFENQYIKGNPHQGVETFDDIKPTIKDMKNASGELIGEVLGVAYDDNDNDVTDTLSDGSEGYQHPYFYIKLHKFDGENGFDLFKHALESETAKIEMTECQGCPACAFEIQKGTLNADSNSFFNPVKVDGNGNIVSGNYSEKIVSNYNEACENNQNSETNEIWICVKKDDSTLGVVMPNVAGNFKVKKGDKFVLTGIKMPNSYIYAAEARLDEAIVKWMSENNSEEFDYSIKFSRVFLAQHPDFAKRLNENARLHINYNGIEHTLYVSDYTLKADSNILQEVSVVLTKELDAGSSDAMNIANSITNIYKGEGGGLSLEAADQRYLSKRSADISKGRIQFKAGISLGDGRYVLDKNGNIVSNSLKVNDLFSFDEFGNIIAKALGINGKYYFDADGNIIADTVQSADYNYSEQTGFGFYRRKDGKFGLNITDLMIWGKAIFNSLEIRKLYSVGGNIVLSPSSSRIMKVDEVTDEVTGVVTGWKCYLLADDGTTATTNQWMVDDQARCQTFDIEEGIYENVSNKNYWRRITEVSSKNEVITDDNGVTLYDGKKFAWVIISKGDCMEGSDAPSADDTIVCMGNRTNTDRQHMLIMETVGDHAPSICMYRGVNGYSLAGCSIFDVSHDGVNVVSKYFKLTAASGEKVWSPVNLGAWQEGKTYGYYDQVDHEGTLWLCIAPEGTEVTEEPQESSAYWRAVTAIVPVEMKISRDFDGFRYGTVGNIQCSVFRGVTDLTGCVTTWKVSRDSGSEQDDTAWGLSDKAKNFDGSIRLACNAQENDFGSGDTVTFTFTAIGDTKLLATRSLMFV